MLYIAHISQDDSISMVLFSLKQGHSAPCIAVMRCTCTTCKPCERNTIQSRRAPIGVVTVRRVHIATRVAVPNVVRVVAVSRATEAVLRRYSLQPVIFSIVAYFRLIPRFYGIHCFIYKTIPICDFPRSNMKPLLCNPDIRL